MQRPYIYALVFLICWSFSQKPVIAQELDIKFSISGMKENDKKKSQAQEKKTVRATISDTQIQLEDGTVLAIKYQKEMFPYPHIEVLQPVGAKASISYEDRVVFSSEIPFLWKDAKIDRYLSLRVETEESSWSVRFMPKKQFRTIIGGAGAPKQVVEASPAPEPAKAVRVKTLKPSYGEWDSVIVEFSGLPGNSSDWINIVPVGSKNDTWGTWQYTSGKTSGQLDMGYLKAGSYEVRLYFDYPNGGYTVHDSYRFTVK